MAYKVKYTKTVETQGIRWDLIILQDTEESIKPIEIGLVLQGLRLCVQGEQADVDTPIVKTSLEMVFVDAPDLDESRKCGYWEEFYTSSATEYKVMLYKDGTLEWTGYITPDSFSETLQYRGSVTIIARDNLGALQDFPYDGVANSETGLIPLFSLVDQAMAVIDFPMEYNNPSGGVRSNLHVSEMITDVDIYGACFNSDAFEGRSWYDVIESVLYATGMTLRYVGGNEFILAPVRDIPLYGKIYNWLPQTREVQFCAYGHRELSPAAKNIKEEVSFDLQEGIVYSNMTARCYGEEQSYPYGDSFSGIRYSMPLHVPIAGLFRVLNEEQKNILLNPFAYELNRERMYGTGGAIQSTDMVYVCANPYVSYNEAMNYRVGFKQRIPAGKYKISCEVNKAVALYDNNTKIGYVGEKNLQWTFRYQAQFVGDDGSIKTLNNVGGADLKAEVTWEDINSNGAHVTRGYGFPVSVESPVLDTEVAGEITVKLESAYLPTLAFYEPTETGPNGGYLGIKNFKLESVDNGGVAIMDTLRINTEYDKKNNVTVSRNPSFACNPTNLIHWAQIKNGIFVDTGETYEGVEQWVFNSSDTPQPLAVLIHQQLLCFYAKPNNILTGELITPNPDFCSLYEWKGKKHIITSGNLNILTGRMENAVLREFTRYDHLWEMWVEQDIYQVDYLPATITARVYSKKFLVASDLQFPDWISGYVDTEDDGVYLVVMNVQGNNTGATRRGIVKIDTAYVLVEQFGAGDYGIDYGSDYS